MGGAGLITHVNYETGSCCVDWIQGLFMCGDMQRFWSSGEFNAEDYRLRYSLS